MPQLANAKKALLQSQRRAARRKPKIDEIHSTRRTFRKLIEAGKIDEAKAMLSKMDKMLDKAVSKKLFKKNKSARVKSRIRASINKATKK